MQADLLLYPTGRDYLLQLLADRPVVEIAENVFIFLQVLVSLYDLQGNIHQFHLKGYVGLLAMRHNPLVAVDVNNVICCQVLHVHKRQCRPADKDEDVAHKSQVRILKLMGHHQLQLILRQEFTFLAVRAYMKLGKGITGYLAIIVRSHYHTLQPHAALPDSSARQTSIRTKVGCELFDEVWCQLQHRHV